MKVICSFASAWNESFECYTDSFEADLEESEELFDHLGDVVDKSLFNIGLGGVQSDRGYERIRFDGRAVREHNLANEVGP